jgi:CIC family chloride channel protein
MLKELLPGRKAGLNCRMRGLFQGYRKLKIIRMRGAWCHRKTILIIGRCEKIYRRVKNIGILRSLQIHILSGYVRKWFFIGIFIGTVAGIGSLALYYAISLATNVFLVGITGFVPPSPISEGGSAIYHLGSYRYYLIPLSTGLGGLISGIIVYSFAPEAEGHGTDAAIEAFHFRKGIIRKRVPVVKLVSSAVTIGSGGSAGREGPVAQIAAGFGSFIAEIMKLDEHDRRIAVAAGIGAGIGSIFMAPLGGALLSTEVLYRRDFEVEALIPSIIASVTGYAIFGYFFNYQPLFSLPSSSILLFLHPQSLLLYAFIGIVTGLAGIVYVATFYGIKNIFSKRLKIPVYFKPALGGVLVGLIAMEFPEVLGLGYGWVQLILLDNLALLPLWILVALIFAKIIATSLTIGSGGSGGVFAPGIVIGTLVGAVIAVFFHDYLGSLFPYLNITEIAIVGMIAFFGGVSKAPISIIIMGTEMTGGYALFLPLMLATTIAYFVSGSKYSIYRAQVIDRMHSPAHSEEYEKPLMDYIGVKEAMNSNIVTVDADMNLADAYRLAVELKASGVVVTRNNQAEGYLNFTELNAGFNQSRPKVADIVKIRAGTINSEATAHDAFNLLTGQKVEILAVFDQKRNEIIGAVGLNDIAAKYNDKIKEISKNAKNLAGDEEF